MARQDRRQALEPPLLCVGIDPGDVWCGFASVAINGHVWSAETRVYDRRQYDFGSLVAHLIPEQAMCVAVERYSHRPVGHQAFASGETQQLIGALRYRAEQYRAEWGVVPAGEPMVELPTLLIGPYLDRWRERWPHKRVGQWHHGFSAWRVLARYMAKRHTNIWTALHHRRKHALETLECVRRHPDEEAQLEGTGLFAPEARWYI